MIAFLTILLLLASGFVALVRHCDDGWPVWKAIVFTIAAPPLSILAFRLVLATVRTALTI